MATPHHNELLVYGYISQYLTNRCNENEIIYVTVSDYAKRCGAISIALAGARNCGKSTLGGRMYYEYNHRGYATLGDASGDSLPGTTEWSSYFDEDEYETITQMTVHGNMHEIYTPSFHISLIDTPASKRYFKNFIRHIAHSDAVIFVFAADHLEDDNNTKRDATLLDQLRIIRLFDITQLIVAVNKMEIYYYSRSKFMKCKQYIHALLEEAGFSNFNQIHVIPISAVCGENILSRSTGVQLNWWSKSGGSDSVFCVHEAIESIGYNHLSIYNKNIICKPFKFSINNIYDETLTGTVIAGRIEHGKIDVGNMIRCYPSGCQGQVESIEIFGKKCDSASYGNIVGLRINEFLLSPQRGDIIVNGNNTTEFDIRLFEVLLTVYPSSIKLNKEYHVGFSPIVYTDSCTKCQCKISAILWKTGPDGKQKDEDPFFIRAGDTAKVLFEPSQQFAIVEGQKVAILEHRELIMAGKCTKYGVEDEVMTM